MSDDLVFHALANPVRRRLLELLADGPRTAGDLAGRFDLSRPAVAEHLQVLRRAELVVDEPAGRRRHYHLTAAPLEQIGDWLHPFERFWRERLRTFADVVENDVTENDVTENDVTENDVTENDVTENEESP